MQVMKGNHQNARGAKRRVASDFLALLAAFDLSNLSMNSSGIRRELTLQKASLSNVAQSVGLGIMNFEQEEYECSKIIKSLIAISVDLKNILEKGDISILEREIKTILVLQDTNILELNLDQENAHDIVLSYARFDSALMIEVKKRLNKKGYSVWCDEAIPGGERFEPLINWHIDQSRAVVVLWTSNSILSDWVRYEAGRAHRMNKHIPLRSPDLPLDSIPAPYAAVLDVVVLGNEAKLISALLVD